MLERFGFLLAIAMLSGCGVFGGGGTEVPASASTSPFQITVSYFPTTDTQDIKSSQVFARQWRLWDVLPQSDDSTLLESRGLLTDSQGVITLPPDSGTYLVEAWTQTFTSPESLVVRIKVPTQNLVDTGRCLTTLAVSSTPTRIPSCTNLRQASPSSASGFSRSLPDVITMVRIPGNPSHKFQILGPTGDTLILGETRLWKVGPNNTLLFQGILRQGLTSSPELPTLTSKEKFVIEAWTSTTAAPSRIAIQAPMDSLALAYLSCVVGITDPLPAVQNLWACRQPVPNLSGGAHAPDYWAAIWYWPEIK